MRCAITRKEQINRVSIDYVKIKKTIGMAETANHPNQYGLVNRLGYMGKYQFHRSTLRTLGFTPKEISRFLYDSALQENAMHRLITYNYNYFLNSGLFACVGDTIGGVCITPEGMLAGAHLLGTLSVQHFLLYDGSMKEGYYMGVYVRKYDGNGTPLTKYMNMF